MKPITAWTLIEDPEDPVLGATRLAELLECGSKK